MTAVAVVADEAHTNHTDTFPALNVTDNNLDSNSEMPRDGSGFRGFLRGRGQAVGVLKSPVDCKDMTRMET